MESPPMSTRALRPSPALANVRYEIRELVSPGGRLYESRRAVLAPPLRIVDRGA
jgi:hypothetical protein